ncbi:MAG TPA: ATPase, T2SS/T4P/T4SS family [bacterium]|nr:ATPase, T2SS/T4P/T4SS family [bacterium]
MVLNARRPDAAPGPYDREVPPPGPPDAVEPTAVFPTDDGASGGSHRAARPIGDLLVSEGLVTREQVARAMEIQHQSGGLLGRILVEMGALSDAQLARSLAQQWGLPYTDLPESEIASDVAQLIPTYLAQRHGVIAISRNGDRLVVAMSDPSNVAAIDDVRLLTGLEVDIVIASNDDLTRAQARLYGIAADVEEVLKQSGQAAEPDLIPEIGPLENVSLDRLRTLGEQAPIVRIVDQIFLQAVRAGASDIHIEPQHKDMVVRFRIDGLLADIMTPPKALQQALTSRIKILASMDIAERRLPQDGHIHLRIEGREHDLRVSTLPTVLGEKCVVRILDQSSTRVSLTRIGLPDDVLAKWESLVSKPYGMIIVTGPTGSGKTTTLYTSLSRINTPERNVVSVEDPVEYQIPRVNQVQVNVRAGLTFASGLRSILRQDPDVVLIGEVRDRETAEIAIQASMTGHLVLTTLHTNDSAGAVTRLTDMGIERFLITSSLIGVLAQRLVRVICPHCKEAYTPPAAALRRLDLDPEQERTIKLYRGRGCDFCRGTGYRGRTGAFELITMSDHLRSLILAGASTDEIRSAAQVEGMRTLRQDGIEKVLSGVTTIEELLRVVFVHDETT